MLLFQRGKGETPSTRKFHLNGDGCTYALPSFKREIGIILNESVSAVGWDVGAARRQVTRKSNALSALAGLGLGDRKKLEWRAQSLNDREERGTIRLALAE